MSNNKLFIPEKLFVGFQNRDDTFTQKLGYVTYEDEKGVHRKATSWNSWRNHNIPAENYSNEPQTGFTLNKGVKRYGYWSGSGRNMVRVFDPRGFEFEITVNNLIFVLMHADVSKRDITIPCVYAWNKDELVLLPTNSQEYEESKNFTKLQSIKVSTKDFIPGRKYFMKKNDEVWTYLGRFEEFRQSTDYDSRGGYFKTGYHICAKKYFVSVGKKHIFAKPNRYSFYEEKYEFKSVSPSSIGGVLDEPDENFAKMVEGWHHSTQSSRPVGFVITPVSEEYLKDIMKDSDSSLYSQKNLSTLPDENNPMLAHHMVLNFTKREGTCYLQSRATVVLSMDDTGVITDLRHHVENIGYSVYGYGITKQPLNKDMPHTKIYTTVNSLLHSGLTPHQAAAELSRNGIGHLALKLENGNTTYANYR